MSYRLVRRAGFLPALFLSLHCNLQQHRKMWGLNVRKDLFPSNGYFRSSCEKLRVCDHYYLYQENMLSAECHSLTIIIPICVYITGQKKDVTMETQEDHPALSSLIFNF